MIANGVDHPVGPSCGPCTAALTNPYAVEYRSGCLDCTVRHLSQLPQQARAKFYAGLASDKERTAYQMAVSAEYRRRKALLTERIVQ